MAHWDISDLPYRKEVLFGDRVVNCRADRPGSVFEMFQQAVARAPDREALVAGDVRLNYSQLDHIVAEVAAGLSARGVEHGDRVALLIGNRAEFVILLYALSRAGAISVPISYREARPGIAYAVNHSGARLLIYDPMLADRVPTPSDLENGSTILPLDDPSTGEMLRSLRGHDIVPAAVKGEQEINMILYTSGTTGKPKGAMLAEVNIVHAVMIYETAMKLQDAERAIVAVPMSHVTGITCLIGTMLRCAGTLIVMEEFKAPAFLELASREKMTATVLVPAMYALCLARANFEAYELSNWRVGCYGGAPMPAPVIEQLKETLPQLQLLNLYGSTETGAAQGIMPPQYAYERRMDVGLPAPGGEVLVMDEQGRECPRGQAGELWLRNASVVRGYWNNPEATREHIVAGFWRSGDLGSMDEEGFIRVLDRIKDMINRGGYKIYTAEVESALMEHPGVLESAVVAKPCPILGERVHAFVSLRGEMVSEADLKAHCTARLADYKRPETYTILADPLPRNANGKLLKREMRDKLLQEIAEA
ncbi:acyl--CoA ligase [Novosphingobium sp. G106]|uniref:class I adenylate-forming enzyme family protein n=1 Tax=Novosphingobium sp. G106 TaxID=2849500 RepID=UPI001C2CD05B|nr:class I adenylate-forming enzyme family protein [Novosphingobium sp. G106]MBV1688889.1 acyl--CoA ligase [Novosphingobium sp. G106]